MARLKTTKYTKLLNSRSSDGGETADFPGPGAKALLTHGAVVENLATVPARWQAKEVWRGNELGFIRLNQLFWGDVDPKGITLSVTQEQHEWIRPIFDALLGPDSSRWSPDDIIESAGQWIDSRLQAGEPFKVDNDVKLWIQIYLHRVHLGMDITPEEAQQFTNVQMRVLAGIVLPQCLVNMLGCVWKGALQFRRETLSRYEEALRSQEAYEGLSAEELHQLASGMLDSLMFAGGLSVASVVSCAMATVYGTNSPCPGLELTGDIIPALVWETIRYYPPVVGFPYYSGPDQTERTILSLASAMRDPQVWGQDFDEFRLRDLATYHRLSVGFADAAHDPSRPSYSRVCPGKELGLSVATGFLTAWSQRQAQWALSDAQAQGIKFTPTTPFISKFEFTPA